MITYEYKLYKTKKVKYLNNMKREACFVWNHALTHKNAITLCTESTSLALE